MKKLNKLFFTALLFITAVSTISVIEAQSISADSLKNQMIRDWQRAKSYTDEYLQSMPADKYSFKAVDSIRSFAQQMLHLAQANIFFASTGAGSKPLYENYSLEGSKTAQSKDSVVYYVDASYDYMINNLKNLPAKRFGQSIKAFEGEYPVYVIFLKGFEHQTHHRGQTTIYIRLLGIRPPDERLF